MTIVINEMALLDSALDRWDELLQCSAEGDHETYHTDAPGEAAP
jgi:hypothetical protein